MANSLFKVIMSLKNIETAPKQSSHPFHPPGLQETPEKNVVAYACFSVLIGLAIVIFILISIRMWLHNRQRHEANCPCRKCKPHIQPHFTRFEKISKPHPPREYLTQKTGEEEAKLLKGKTSDGPVGAEPFRPSGFGFNDEKSNGTIPLNQHPHEAYRKSSSAEKEKPISNKTHIGFDGLLNDEDNNLTHPPEIKSYENQFTTDRLKVARPSLKELITEDVIDGIMEEVLKIEVEVNALPITSETNKDYLILHEKLTRNLIKLDSIDTDWLGSQLARKDCILLTKRLVSALEEKCQDTNTDSPC